MIASRSISGIQSRQLLACVTAVALAACGEVAESRSLDPTAAAAHADSLGIGAAARARQDSINRAQPGYVIDSILPVDEMLRRFRDRTGEPPVTALHGGSPSRDALVRRFVRALAASDSAAFVAMAVTPREFADLVYPESPNVAPPYLQDPALAWRSIQNPSATGLTRLLRRAGGLRLRLDSYRCSGVSRQGGNMLHRGCSLDLLGTDGTRSTHRLFGTIIERGGRFKIMSYSNEF